MLHRVTSSPCTDDGGPRGMEGGNPPLPDLKVYRVPAPGADIGYKHRSFLSAGSGWDAADSGEGTGRVRPVPSHSSMN